MCEPKQDGHESSKTLVRASHKNSESALVQVNFIFHTVVQPWHAQSSYMHATWPSIEHFPGQANCFSEERVSQNGRYSLIVELLCLQEKEHGWSVQDGHQPTCTNRFM